MTISGQKFYDAAALLGKGKLTGDFSATVFDPPVFDVLDSAVADRSAQKILGPGFDGDKRTLLNNAMTGGAVSDSVMLNNNASADQLRVRNDKKAEAEKQRNFELMLELNERLEEQCKELEKIIEYHRARAEKFREKELEQILLAQQAQKKIDELARFKDETELFIKKLRSGEKIPAEEAKALCKRHEIEFIGNEKSEDLAKRLENANKKIDSQISTLSKDHDKHVSNAGENAQEAQKDEAAEKEAKKVLTEIKESVSNNASFEELNELSEKAKIIANNKELELEPKKELTQSAFGTKLSAPVAGPSF